VLFHGPFFPYRIYRDIIALIVAVFCCSFTRISPKYVGTFLLRVIFTAQNIPFQCCAEENKNIFETALYCLHFRAFFALGVGKKVNKQEGMKGC
jgi:hypothetical protein